MSRHDRGCHKAKDYVGEGRGFTSEHKILGSLGWPASEFQGSACLCPPTSGLPLCTAKPAFYVNVGVLSLGFYACRASILTEQGISLAPQGQYFIITGG